MIQPPGTASGREAGVPAALVFAVSGVVQHGPASPRLGHRRAGGGYDDAHRIAGDVVAVDDGVSLRFALPAVAVDFILIEPVAIPGSYCIPHMVYAGVAVDDLQQRVIAAYERMGEAEGLGAVRFSSRHGRPSVEIDVRGLGGAAGGAGANVELLLRRDADSAAAADAIARVQDALAHGQDANQAALARLARMLPILSSRMDGVVDAIGTPADGPGQHGLAGRIEALVAADAARDARVAALEQQLAALAGTLGHTERSIAALTAMVERIGASQDVAGTAATAGREVAARDSRTVRDELSTLQGQVERVADSMDNLFWRRWSRRLRGGGR